MSIYYHKMELDGSLWFIKHGKTHKKNLTLLRISAPQNSFSDLAVNSFIVNEINFYLYIFLL